MPTPESTPTPTGGDVRCSMPESAFPRWENAIANAMPMAPLREVTPNVMPAAPPTQSGIENPCCMYRVPHRLRELNETAYEPNVISIGPYHYGKPHLKAMDAIKRSCFLKLVDGNSLHIREFTRAMRTLEARVRECYEEPLPLQLGDSDEFVRMMLYDGCFLVQLIRRVYPEDDIFQVARFQTDIRSDLLLLENQLPFFVVFKLLRMIMPNVGEDVHHFARTALFSLDMPGNPVPNKDIKHLLELVHNSYHPSALGIKRHQDFKAKAAEEAREPESQRLWRFIRSATELEDAGIGFFGANIEKMRDQEQGIESMFDIMFTKDTNVLKIPTLEVNDQTESFFRNFMAYEQFISSVESTYVSDYVLFMDNLINTGKDVQLLCKRGIIDNWLGDDEVVAQMFNKLRDSIYVSGDFYYAEIFGRVNKHCERKWNKWKAALKKNYFHSPWSLISVLAAFVLLVLTLLQTIFSVLSYFNQ
ncbi:hypothetical protein V6N13_000765 [Hibiscus sabdariffa]